MKFDKRISGLLAKSLLIPLGISCFNFCCVSAMESKATVLPKEEQKLIETLKMMGKAEKQNDKKIIGNKRSSSGERQHKKAQKQKNDERRKVNQCIRTAIILERSSSVKDFLSQYRQTEFVNKKLFFAHNIVPVHVKMISNIISNLRKLNKEGSLTKDSPASSLLSIVENIEKIISKSSTTLPLETTGDDLTDLPLETTGDDLTDRQLASLNTLIPDEQFDSFNKNFKVMIESFLGVYKGQKQNNTAESFLKTLNIRPASEWDEKNPEKARARAKKCIYDVICMLKSHINLEEEKK